MTSLTTTLRPGGPCALAAKPASSGRGPETGVWSGPLTKAGTAAAPLGRCCCWMLGGKIRHALIWHNVSASAPALDAVGDLRSYAVYRVAPATKLANLTRTMHPTNAAAMARNRNLLANLDRGTDFKRYFSPKILPRHAAVVQNTIILVVSFRIAVVGRPAHPFRLRGQIPRIGIKVGNQP